MEGLWASWKSARSLYLSGTAAAGSWAAAGAGRRLYAPRQGLHCTVPLPMDGSGSVLMSLLKLGTDPRFLLGLVLGWKVLAELLKPRRQRAASRGSAEARVGVAAELAKLQAKAEELQGQLATARAATNSAERLLLDSRERGRQKEFAILTLEAEVARLEGQVSELQAALRGAIARVEVDGPSVAAENSRLVAENQAALQELRALAAALAAQHQAAAAAAEEAAAARRRRAAEGDAQAELQGENEALRRALGEVRGQLAEVMRENAELADRLLQVAFEEGPSHDGHTPITSPVRRSRALSADPELQRRASAAAQQMQGLATSEPSNEHLSEAPTSTALGSPAGPAGVSPFSSPPAQPAQPASGASTAFASPISENGRGEEEAEDGEEDGEAGGLPSDGAIFHGENDSGAHNSPFAASPAASLKGFGAGPSSLHRSSMASTASSEAF